MGLKALEVAEHAGFRLLAELRALGEGSPLALRDDHIALDDRCGYRY
jgi:hypothetical protein